MSTRIFQFVLGFVCFIQQFVLWQKTSKYINCTYGCNILGQLHYLKAQYASSSKNVIWPGAEIIFPAALAAEIQTYWRAQQFPEKSPLNGPLFLKSKPRFFFSFAVPLAGGCQGLKAETWWGCAGKRPGPGFPVLCGHQGTTWALDRYLWGCSDDNKMRRAVGENNSTFSVCNRRVLKIYQIGDLANFVCSRTEMIECQVFAIKIYAST